MLIVSADKLCEEVWQRIFESLPARPPSMSKSAALDMDRSSASTAMRERSIRSSVCSQAIEDDVRCAPTAADIGLHQEVASVCRRGLSQK